ncbi:hypothetical protein [Lentzea sp. NPDC059081]|uniref:hypothetical protein n=1 Tax=Lentzea sp. NPDC059081 TaxID=3346719 RepID=UPI0036824695
MDRDNCSLVVLDANAVLVLRNKSADRMNPRSEECRGRLKELAPVFFAAVRP